MEIVNGQKKPDYLSQIASFVKYADVVLLCIVVVATLIATGQELRAIATTGSVKLADVLLLFIYAEILGMIGVSIKSSKFPITLTLFIAMTALARYIVLQNKEIEPITLLYESVAILVIAAAVFIIRMSESKWSRDE